MNNRKQQIEEYELQITRTWKYLDQLHEIKKCQNKENLSITNLSFFSGSKVELLFVKNRLHFLSKAISPSGLNVSNKDLHIITKIRHEIYVYLKNRDRDTTQLAFFDTLSNKISLILSFKTKIKVLKSTNDFS